MKFIFTDVDRYFKDEYQETWLSEETGWWETNGNVWIYTVGLSKLQQVGIAVHECFEYFVVERILRKVFFKTGNVNEKGWFDFLSDIFHNVANYLELIASIGNASISPGEQYWRIGRWDFITSIPHLIWKKREMT